MSILVAKQNHFDKIKGVVGNLFAKGPGNCGTCNCSGCANCGSTGGCASYCDVGPRNCGHRIWTDEDFKVFDNFFAE